METFHKSDSISSSHSTPIKSGWLASTLDCLEDLLTSLAGETGSPQAALRRYHPTMAPVVLAIMFVASDAKYGIRMEFASSLNARSNNSPTTRAFAC